MHIRVQNEFSVINHASRRRGHCRKKENGCHLKYVGQIYLIFHVHILWVHVHFYAKIQSILLSNLWLFTDDNDTNNTDSNDNNTQRRIHNSWLHRLFGIHAKWAKNIHRRLHWVTPPSTTFKPPLYQPPNPSCKIYHRDDYSPWTPSRISCRLSFTRVIYSSPGV